MRAPLLLLLCVLAGCEATPLAMVAEGPTAGVASITILHRSPFDAIYSLVTGKDCSVVRLDRGQTYCRQPEPPPETPPLCTRSLGVVDCWADRAALPNHPVADGSVTLTPRQEADRTRGWP
jgi:hypothetical protein